MEGRDHRNRATVVVVDDDAGNRLAISAVLEPLGENVLVFESGEAALKHLVERPDCAVVILDVNLGAVGGFEVARLLRQRERTRNIPVVFLTGNSGESALAGYAEGAVDFITKPFDPDALRGKVSGLVKLHKERRALERERDDSFARERRARAETASEREYLHRFLAQFPALIARMRGPLHVFEFVNAGYIEAIGRDPTGKPIREALPDLEGQSFFGLLDQVYSTGTPFEAREVPVSLARGPDGALETVYLNFVYQPTRGGDGRVDGILVHAVDVTAQVKARQAAEALSSELKTTAGELQRLAAFQRQLLAIVGHDLRNPLGAILATAQSMLKKPQDEALAAAAVARIARSATRMNRIINDLLDFTQARLEGGLKVVRETCNIAEVCKQVVEELSMVYPGRAIRVECVDRVTGEWDSSRLQQVISNLVANGLQYSARDSEVVVRVEEGPSKVRLQVANQGTPIPGPLLGKLFEPFQRATAEERTGNVGLGLYIVDQLIRAHGGSVEVSSTETEGTTFTVHLPRAA